MTKSNVIHHIVTDQGNGSWYCDCGAEGTDPIYKCPSCGTMNSDLYINEGGSDFD